ncbi:hypothetical protein ACJ73_07124 [Blastomyces percursus]|uniref:Dynamin GTPase domain-containing protein n=1 Tax=Blastomyces percursus TaxID=1658174 RepID=A0A1J9PYY1_9EURO|nr:hypothetical protein ACJ73_07124 [Blastomyces percursus]
MVQHKISLGSRHVSDSPESVAESAPLIVEENDSIDVISRTMKALVKKIQDLRHLGIENDKLSLPKICVVGDQSTGKSSLIEGMTSHEDYILGNNLGIDETTQVKFSPNVVRLGTYAPCFPNLSFYDLPGVINVAAIDTEKYLVTLVENIVKQYISTSNCIVLLTLPMTDDATNSSAARIIREVGAASRTLGVLTKPDRIGYGEEYDQWKKILRVEHAQAREEEEEFFSSGPWRNELVEYSDRFGTRNLQMAFSKLLNSRLSSVYPFILSDKLNEFNILIRAHMNGMPPGSDYPLQKQWMKIAADFQHSLSVGRHLRTRETARLQKAVCLQTNKRRAGTVEPDGGVKRQVNSAIMHNAPRSSQHPYSTEHFGRFKGPVKIFALEEIRDISSDTYASGVPGLANPYAVEEMNKLSVM